jgi:hypothetical protein
LDITFSIDIPDVNLLSPPTDFIIDQFPIAVPEPGTSVLSTVCILLLMCGTRRQPILTHRFGYPRTRYPQGAGL